MGLLALACAVILGAGAASASSAGNHSFLTDPAGDNQRLSDTNYASDIRSVDITSQDNGVVHIAVTVADAGRFFPGDELYVAIDYDRNPSTGSNGIDLAFFADGSSSGTTFLFCTYTSVTDCQDGLSGWAHDQSSSTPGQHVVDFTVTMGIPAFDFYVKETYNSLFDRAPDSGYWTYETKADPDRDGLYGTADRCPTVHAAPNRDKNHNGCPGPFGLIHEQFHHATTGGPPGYLLIVKSWISNVPPGAKVVFASPRGGEGRKANSSGVASSRTIRENFHYGSVIGIRITKGGFVGVSLKAVVKPGGIAIVRRSCLPATGGPPTRCTGALKGS